MKEFNFKQYLKEGKLLKEEDFNYEEERAKLDTPERAAMIARKLADLEDDNEEEFVSGNQTYSDEIRRDEANNLADDIALEGDEKQTFIADLMKATDDRTLHSSGSPWDTFYGTADLIMKKYLKEDKKYTRAEIEQAERDYFSGRMSKEEFNELVFGDERKLNDDSQDLEEGRYGPGRGMDDEYDEPRGRRSSYKDALMNPPTPSGNQEEEEFEDIETDIEFGSRGRDYDAQNQKVLRSMRESKFEKALKNASKKLAEDKLVKENNISKNHFLTRGQEYSILEPGMNEYLDNLEFIGYDSNEREYVFIDSINISPGSNDVFFIKVPDSEIDSALGKDDVEENKLTEGKKKKKKKKEEIKLIQNLRQKLYPEMFDGVVEDAMIEMDIDSISDISSDKSKSKKFLKFALKGMKKQNEGDHQKLKKLSEKEQLDFFIKAAHNI
tara:strand:- start:4723 stop:6042 length:1320 start_codon:yes stop_codon:yes gene_type:complete